VIHKSHEVKMPAPFVASFSSRGPNSGSQHVLKVPIVAIFPPLNHYFVNNTSNFLSEIHSSCNISGLFLAFKPLNNLLDAA
jgi:hypothetical protein